MNILFLTRKKRPSIGGVEKHIDRLTNLLIRMGHGVQVLSEKDVKHPYVKLLGLFYIWFWLFKNRKLIIKSDVVHCHDVFIWYLPFRFLFPLKPIYTTFHGWEEEYPIPWSNILQKKLASKLSWRNIAVGKYIEKFYGIKTNALTYGASVTSLYNSVTVKQKNRIVYVGRLEENTGLLQFLDWLKNNKKYSVDFCGDGRLRTECEKYGTVHGFCDPNPFYKKAKICVPGGYLAALEALSYNCELKLFWNNQVKEDYWKMSPFYKLKGNKLKAWANQQTWEKLTNEYLDLYHNV